MSRNREPCPKCREKNSDKSGDNLINFSNGWKRCFACGYKIAPKLWLPTLPLKDNLYEPKSLPIDFTRDIPAKGWKWLLQWGLSYDYWKNHTGYSESEDRLIFTNGNPIKFCQGRNLGKEGPKWKTWGRPHEFATVLGDQEKGSCTVLVEDIISAHKVSQLVPTVPLFGTTISTSVIQYLAITNKPILLWLDYDQLSMIKTKVNRLSLFLNNPIYVVHTTKDPKEYSLTEIQEILNDTYKPCSRC